ncbi:MAG: type II secretion system protein M [Idiomarina sp.]|nr:type II secretion system protein M [Idiomarina sp.]
MSAFKQRTDELLRQAKLRWTALQPRERVLVSIMAVLVAMTSFWLLVWQPIVDGVGNAEQRLMNQQSMLRFVEEQAGIVTYARQNTSRQTVTPVRTGELGAYINQVSGELNLEITRTQPQNESRVVVFNEASFDALLQLVENLTARGVVIENLDVSETNEPGIVRVRRLQVRAAG